MVFHHSRSIDARIGDTSSDQVVLHHVQHGGPLGHYDTGRGES